MSSPEKRTPRRSARQSTAPEPPLSPVASHPIGQEPEPAAPKSTARRRSEPAAKQNHGGAAGGSSSSGTAVAVLVALLAVGGSVWYSQVRVQQQPAAGAATGAPRKQQRREPTTLLEGGIQAIPQPVPPLPPLPPLTREQEAVFEQVGGLAQRSQQLLGCRLARIVCITRRSPCRRCRPCRR